MLDLQFIILKKIINIRDLFFFLEFCVEFLACHHLNKKHFKDMT